MEPAKYIVLDQIHMVIFGGTMSHVDVAQRFQDRDVTSAGLVMLNVFGGDAEVRCFGESLTLHKTPADGDSRLANLILGDL